MDDDNYVNPWALLRLLRAFPAALDVYVGRPSLNRPIRASEPQPRNRTVCPALLLCPLAAGPRGGADSGRGQFRGGADPGAWPTWGGGVVEATGGV